MAYGNVNVAVPGVSNDESSYGASGETHTCSMGNFKISTATIVRTACLLLALANQMLSAMGKPIIPIRISPMLMPSAFTP